MSFKLGIIGAGAIGGVHAGAAKANGIEVVSVTDVNEEAAKNFAKREGLSHYTSKLGEMLANKDITAVVVAVPNKFHAPSAIAALEAGKDVLLEKPMALNADECRKVIAAAKKYKRILQIGFVNRYSTAGINGRQLAEQGVLGNVYHAKANIYRRRGVPGLGGWFTTKSLSGGGPLIDLGVHIVDLAMYVLNFPKPLRCSGKVYANFGKRMKNYVYEGMWAGPPRLDGICDVEDSAHALIRLDGGATLEVNATWAGNFVEGTLPSVMAFLGDKGGMTFQLGGNEIKIATEQNGKNVDVTPKLRDTNAFNEQSIVFRDNCVNRTQPHASGHCGLVVQSILDAIYRSSEEDREVEIKV
jgi:predicted dehydrogenase